MYIYIYIKDINFLLNLLLIKGSVLCQSRIVYFFFSSAILIVLISEPIFTLNQKYLNSFVDRTYYLCSLGKILNLKFTI